MISTSSNYNSEWAYNNNRLINYCSNNYNNFCHPTAYVCVSDPETSYVAVIDLIECSNIMNIPCGENSDPYNIAINPSQNAAYVADYSNNAILMIDLCNNRVIESASVAGTPVGLTVSPCGQFVYVVFNNIPIIQILNACSLENVGQIDLPAPGSTIYITQDCKTAYVTLPSLNQTAAINLSCDCLMRLFDTGLYPSRIASSCKTPLILIAGRDSMNLTPLNTRKMCTQGSIPLGSIPSGLAYTCNINTCLVALPEDNSAAFVDMCSYEVVNRVPVGTLPGGVAASTNFPVAAVTNQADGTVSILDTNTMSVSCTVYIGGLPRGIVIKD